MPTLRRVLRRLSRIGRGHRQRVFAFVERREHRERRFKLGIILATAFLIFSVLRFFPWGRYLAASLETRTSGLAKRALGLENSRAELKQQWANYRRLGIERTMPPIRKFYESCDPNFQRVLRYAGMDPDHALVRWGNYNWTFLLSSKVYEADDEGRSYRLRPNYKSIWLTQLNTLAGAMAFYLVPDTPELAKAIKGTTAIAVETSRQTTNSWGLRGPEPDVDAPLRIMVLGDSYMQGMFIGDDETPPECLRRYLERMTHQRVSVLNTGVMGYSPEQYHAALVKFADRFQPDAVIVSCFANDCGSEFDAVSSGAGDWYECAYWLEEIREFCSKREYTYLYVTEPFEYPFFKRRMSGNYPGKLINLLECNSSHVLDPMDSFLDQDLRARNADRREGREPPELGVLFNWKLKDGHFSAVGAELWAEVTGQRLLLLMEEDQLTRSPKKPARAPATPLASIRGDGPVQDGKSLPSHAIRTPDAGIPRR